MNQADIGAEAPPLELPTSTGALRSLQEFRGRPVLLSFLGPANCQFCRAHIIQLIRAKDEIAKVGAEVVLVGHHEHAMLMNQLFRSLDLPYLLLVDLQRKSHARWGLRQASLTMLLHPGLYWAVFRMILRRPPSLGKADHHNQLSGEFVIDRRGKLAFVNRMKNIYDWSKVSDLIAALQRA
jgi:peroxiredoxin